MGSNPSKRAATTESCDELLSGQKTAAQDTDHVKLHMDGSNKHGQSLTAESTFGDSMMLPECRVPDIPVGFPFVSGESNSKWPISSYAALNVNVNAKEGGMASLILVSNGYGAEGKDTTAELFLHRCGYDSNYQSWQSIARNHSGHFQPATSFITAENGSLIANCMFGYNHIALLSNNPRYGHLGHGLCIEGGFGPVSLFLDVNSGTGCGAGCSLVLCSGTESGLDSVQLVYAVYMLRCGHSGDIIQSVLICGEDRWQFLTKDSILHIDGPLKSRYALYHNRDILPHNCRTSRAKVWHTATVNGSESVVIATATVLEGVLLVLCSYSDGIEDHTAAAMYVLTISSGAVRVTREPFVVTGKNNNDANLWNFSLLNNQLKATGPKAPCRYVVLSNLVEDQQPTDQTIDCCLATGLHRPIKGAVSINENYVLGWIEQQHDVIIKINEVPAAKIPASSLNRIEDKFAFHRKWLDAEKKPGLYLVRIFFIYSKQDGSDVMIELDGSPQQIIYQPTGVVYALNCGSPAYHALNDVVYTSEHHQFVNFSFDFCFGTRCKAKGCVKPHSSEPKFHTNTYDGFLYMTSRATETEAKEERNVVYEVPNLPNGKMILRLHSVKDTAPHMISVCGTDITGKVAELMKKQKTHPGGVGAITIDVPICISDNKLVLSMHNHMLCAFAVFNATFKEKSLSREELERENIAKQKLIDTVEPLARRFTKKERTILGWSQNLLLNASGEVGDLSNWDVSGDWIVVEGGYGTEKAFATSYMDCVKLQRVDLTQHFSREYLDTAPAIQVSEWYREGCGGGGYYWLETTLENEAGEVIGSYNTGQIGNIYCDMKWAEAQYTFTNYVPGAAVVTIKSFGKDDKYWAGHYGTRMSAAMVRVKHPVTPDDNDQYIDVVPSMDELTKCTKKIEKLINQVLTENHHLLKELGQNETILETDKVVHKPFNVAQASELRKRRALVRKKREMRVFVSSTFKDFKKEREQLIKKTFREISMLCMERNVFFTYVDLRWGITEEQTNHGQTIAICLKEIERCRPYFICMMGDRFGWSQQEDEPDELLNQSFDFAIKAYPKELSWIEPHRYGTSVTELELLHGVLNDIPARKARSFVYLRDSVKDGIVPDDEIKVYKAESDWHEKKQQNLRKLVLETDINTRSYRTPREVCDLIKKDLKFCVDNDFSQGTELSSIEKEREAHVSFAEARRRIYIARESYFEQINHYMHSNNDKPFVILGESGAGKSALIANWVGRIEELEPEAFVFVHFIGSSAKSVSYIKLLRRLFEELKDFFHLDWPVPSSDTDLVRDLGMWLKMASSQAKCYLVLDALNQLDDGSRTEGVEHDLHWLPKTLPPNVKMLLSTLPGRSLEAVKARRWPVLYVDPLQEDEKLQILEGYLEDIYGKTLSMEQKSLIINAKQTNNPLYLKALLDEVRMYGNFRDLTDKIKVYLEAETPADLFAKILERLEQDFERGLLTRPGLVRDTTVAIWCSNRGMSEAELLDLLEVPNALWSPFYLSLVESLVNRNGIVNFFHDHLRQAVEKKYLESKEDKIAGYLWLADFFDKKEINDRKVDELPTLLSKAGATDKLRKIITNMEVFRRLTQTEEGKFDLIKFWNQHGDISQVEEAYCNGLHEMLHREKDRIIYRQTAKAVTELFIDLGFYNSAKMLLNSILKELEKEYHDTHSEVLYWPKDHTRQLRCTHPVVIQLLIKLGKVCYKQNDLVEAAEYYRDATLRINRVQSPEQKLQLTEALLGWADVLLAQEDMPSAKKCLIRCREVATEVLGFKHHYVAAISNILGKLAYKQGHVDKALAHFFLDLILTRGEVGLFHPRLANILNEIALVYDDKNDLKAGELFEAALMILLDTYGCNYVEVAVLRYNLGIFYFANHSFLRAKFQLEKAAEVFMEYLGSEHPHTQEANNALKDLLNIFSNK